MIFLHDAYFYWTHRLLHLRGWYEKIHITHHLSSSPNPWTALAFHPVEAVIQAAIFPVIIMTIPTHPVALFIFLFYMVFMNVRGHSGFQLFPFENGMDKWDWWNNSSKQHDEHHQYAKGNYGLYFTLWDKWMKTGRK
jgi:sterol desaturase/sphingolipid hydroxylase (fatty acid hydroxylase superfamily)